MSLDDLGSEAFSWYDLAAFYKHIQADSQSALSRELHGPVWTMEAQLIALVADHLAMANWQRAGRKHSPKPQRIPRPWEQTKSTALGKDAIPISEFEDWWASQSTKKAPTA